MNSFDEARSRLERKVIAAVRQFEAETGTRIYVELRFSDTPRDREVSAQLAALDRQQRRSDRTPKTARAIAEARTFSDLIRRGVDL